MQIGTVGIAAARALGLRADVPVVNGCGGAGVAMLGASMTQAGDAYVYLGTSAWAALVREVNELALPHELYTLAHPTPGLAIRIEAMLCGDDSAAWFAQLARAPFART